MPRLPGGGHAFAGGDSQCGRRSAGDFCAGGDFQGGTHTHTGGDSCKKDKDNGTHAHSAKMTHTTPRRSSRPSNPIMLRHNIVLKGRATPMRYVSGTHRVNLVWLCDVVQDDGHISVMHDNEKHQCAGAEVWNILVSINWLFDVNNHKVTMLRTRHMHCEFEQRWARCHGDAEMQHIANWESGARSHCTLQCDISVSGSCMLIGHVYHGSIPSKFCSTQRVFRGFLAPQHEQEETP